MAELQTKKKEAAKYHLTVMNQLVRIWTEIVWPPFAFCKCYFFYFYRGSFCLIIFQHQMRYVQVLTQSQPCLFEDIKAFMFVCTWRWIYWGKGGGGVCTFRHLWFYLSIIFDIFIASAFEEMIMHFLLKYYSRPVLWRVVDTHLTKLMST